MPSRSQVRGGHAVILLELAIGGTIWRFATESCDVTRAQTARVERWSEGLVDLKALPRSASTAGITIAPFVVDWAKLVARGLDLSMGRATLRRWYSGQDLEEAEVILTGPVEEAECGPISEPLSFQIGEEPWRDRTTIPSPSMRISSTTWPVDADYRLDAVAVGQYYPIPIGYPGSATVGRVPAYLVEVSTGAHLVADSKFLFSGIEVAATSVFLHDASDELLDVVATLETTDLLGRTVAYVKASGADVRAIEGHEYYVSLVESMGGGVYNREKTACLRGAGELIAWLYGEGLSRIDPGLAIKVPVDKGRMEAQRAYLDKFLIDTVIQPPTDVHDWVSANLASLIPMEWVRGREGGYWLAWRFDATAEQAVDHLDTASGRIRRLGRKRTAGSSEVRTQFRLDYNPGIGSTFQSYAVLAAEATDDENVRANYRCYIAREREKLRWGGGNGIVEHLMRTEAIKDPATAQRVLEAQAAMRAIPPESMSYEGGPELEALDRGDVVLVSDSELYFVRRVALVEDVTPGETVRIDLKLLADPDRVNRRVT